MQTLYTVCAGDSVTVQTTKEQAVQLDDASAVEEPTPVKSCAPSL